MLPLFDHHYRQLTKHWSASNKAELERWLVKPLTVTMKELDIIMCGRHKSKTLKNKGLPEAVGTKGRATQYLYLDLVQMSGWNDLPSESEARKILRHQVSMSDSFRD